MLVVSEKGINHDFSIESMQGVWSHACMQIMYEWKTLCLRQLFCTFLGVLCCGLVNFFV